MRILALTKYSRNGASSRLRFLQFLTAFNEKKHSVDVAPFFSEGYLEKRYQRSFSFSTIFWSYIRRIFKSLNARNYDVLWVEKEILPFCPYIFEKLFLGGKCKLVLDYDDAIFHLYDQHENSIVRHCLATKIDRLMKKADVVCVGSQYLFERADEAGAARVFIIPTVVDIQRYSVKPSSHNTTKYQIGWIGSPATTHYLKAFEEPFKAIKKKYHISLKAVGAKQSDISDQYEAVDWSEETETWHLGGFDIGIMPLTDEPWSRGKCGYKIIQYMAAGIPVVASRVGANADLIVHGKTGFLVNTEQEWIFYIEQLLENSDFRKAMGEAGRKLAEEKYSTQAQGPRLVDLFESTN